jgi:hypothetical protein
MKSLQSIAFSVFCILAMPSYAQTLSQLDITNSTDCVFVIDIDLSGSVCGSAIVLNSQITVGANSSVLWNPPAHKSIAGFQVFNASSLIGTYSCDPNIGINVIPVYNLKCFGANTGWFPHLIGGPFGGFQIIPDIVVGTGGH